MSTFYSLPASLRITVLVFGMAACAMLLFCVVYAFLGRKKLFAAYCFSLAFAVLVMLLTRTPVVYFPNETLPYALNYSVVLPMIVGIVLLARTGKKEAWVIADVTWLIVQLPAFFPIPYWGYIASGSLVFLLARTAHLLYICLSNVRRYPGRLGIKYALDNTEEGIAFVNRYGQIAYINPALKNVLDEMGISSYGKASEIVKSVFDRAERNGRIVSERSAVVGVNERFYKFDVEKPLSQIVCMDVTKEEKLTKEAEESGQRLAQTNAELKKAFSSVEDVDAERELLALKGYIHDELAQQLSVLHTFLLQDDSIDLTGIKKMLDLPESTQWAWNKARDPEETKELLAMLGVELCITGTLPVEADARAYALKFIKETATNALRHGKAKRINVRFEQDGNDYVLSATDDGESAETFSYGNGLTSLAFGAEKAGGTMRVDLSPGFTVVARLPRSY